MDLFALYQSLGEDTALSRQCRVLLKQTHWFSVNCEFDPKTGEALPQAISAFLSKVGQADDTAVLHDRLWRITEHVRPSLKRLFRALNQSPRREHAMLPVRAVRELDANSFIKLSNRPGRNIREKLANKPYLQAVRRFQSVDLPENRLLKSFVIRLAELLELRSEFLEEHEDEILSVIHSWLRSEEAKAIARWDNLPPNNTLLSHREYRRVWDAWRWLQSLNNDIASDLSQLDLRQEVMTNWIGYGRMYRERTHLFAETPVTFNFENFSIQPWLTEPLKTSSERKIHRDQGSRVFTEPTCIDLVPLRPRFSTPKQHHMALAESFLWQQWRSDSEAIDLTLFESDAACLHPDAVTISCAELFFGSDKSRGDLDRAARAFASRLSDTFKDDKLIWLVPDALNDFELEIIRRNLNSRFSDSEPLPRSVATVFQQLDHSKIKGEGYTVVVVDQIEGVACATTLIARRDKDLAKRLPQTKGFYWERCPPVVLTRAEDEVSNSWRGDILTVDQHGNWRAPKRPARHQKVDPASLKDRRIGQFNDCIQIAKSPVAGGLLFYAMQENVGEIPLWRDQIPELSIKVMKDGRYQRFLLVSRGTTIKPIRGLPILIPIAKRFTLPAGKRYYEFPLYQGENADELRFSARLESPAFPLKSKTECELKLTFQYGADEPYNLVFVPLDKSFPPVRASWQRTVEKIVTDAPAPGYPAPLSWDDLRRWHDPHGNEVDLLAWLIDSLERLVDLVPHRRMISISSSWMSKEDNDGNKYWFAFAMTEDGQECYCNSKSLVTPTDEDPNVKFPYGTELYGNIKKARGGPAAFELSSERKVRYTMDVKQRILSFRERSLQNRMTTILADGRSIADVRCPIDFRSNFNDLIKASSAESVGRLPS